MERCRTSQRRVTRTHSHQPIPDGRQRRYQMVMRLLLVLLLPGCFSGIGQQSIPRDRFDYNSAIANSWKEQMLLNMVRLRYGEAPVFLNVASIIAQYSLEGRVSLSGGLQTSVTGGDTLSLQGAGRWADRPTITYIQQTGQEFRAAC